MDMSLVGYSPWGHYYMNNSIIILNCETDVYVCVCVCVLNWRGS